MTDRREFMRFRLDIRTLAGSPTELREVMQQFLTSSTRGTRLKVDKDSLYYSETAGFNVATVYGVYEAGKSDLIHDLDDRVRKAANKVHRRTTIWTEIIRLVIT